MNNILKLASMYFSIYIRKSETKFNHFLTYFKLTND